jgi:GxxExxY protein
MTEPQRGAKGAKELSLNEHTMNSESAKSEIFQLCDKVRETGFAIHRYLRHGHVEKIYQNALVHRLRKQGIHAETEVPLQVYDEDGTVLGDFRADIIGAGQLIIEVKARKALENEDIAQLLGYLRAARVEHGLLINFGAAKFEIRKFALRDAVLPAGSSQSSQP